VAVVLEAGKRGFSMSSGNETTWNNEVALKVRIRVEPVNEASFDWEGRLRFWETQTPVADDRIWVLFDPNDHENLMVDFSERPGAFGGHFSKEANADTTAGLTWATEPAGDGPGPSSGSDLGALLQDVEKARQGAGGDRQKMADLLRQRLGGRATIVDGGSGSAAAPDAPDPLTGLERLADLRDRGALTPEEFEAQKRRLLDEPPA
jgi:hypothetical protein